MNECPHETLLLVFADRDSEYFHIVPGDLDIFQVEVGYDFHDNYPTDDDVLVDVKDGLENTLLLAQVLQSSIPWSEPRDFDFQEFSLSSKSDGKASSSGDETGFKNQRLLFADFESYRVLRPIPLKYFEALWTYSGSDGVTRDELIRQGYLSR